MVVPSVRLLKVVAAVALPLSVVGLVTSAGPWLGVAALLAVAAAALADLARGQERLADTQVEAPAVLRLAKNRPGGLDLVVRDARRAQPELRLGLPWPEEIRAEGETVACAAPQPGRRYRVRWPCTGLRRGRYRLASCHLECPSPWGLWNVRGRRAIDLEVRVYPDLRSDRRAAAALFLRRGLYGIHLQRLVGRGREFEKLREYIPGDSYEDIHWKATAKRRVPVTKLYQTERTQEVFAVVDASRLSARPAPSDDPARDGPVPPTWLERSIHAALALGLAAEQQGDRFGLMLFRDKPVLFLRPGRGRAHFNACRDALYTAEPETVSPDFAEVFSGLRLRLRKRALLVFLTSLDDPVLAESFVAHARLLSRQHLVTVMMIRPGGARPVFSGGAEDVDDIYRALGGHVRWRRLREVERELARVGVRMLLADREQLSADLLTEYLRVKQRQIL